MSVCLVVYCACEQVFEGHAHYVMQVKFNPKDTNTFASASLDRTIKVWGLTSATPYFSLEGHERGVNCIDYYPGGDKPYLISGAEHDDPCVPVPLDDVCASVPLYDVVCMCVSMITCVFNDARVCGGCVLDIPFAVRVLVVCVAVMVCHVTTCMCGRWWC